MHFTFITLLSPQECLQKLRDSIYIYKRHSYRNSFVPLFFGDITTEGGKTKIIGHFGMHPFTKVFMTFWLAGIAVMVTMVFIINLVNMLSKLQPGKPFLFLFGLLIMSVLGIGLMKFKKWLVGVSLSDDRRVIIEFLSNLLNLTQEPNTV